MSRNPKFNFKVGILNPCHPKPGFKIATYYLIKAFEEGHYPEKYVLCDNEHMLKSFPNTCDWDFLVV